MKATSVIEVLSALHQTRHVRSEYEQRGGIIIVASPGTLKSTLIKCAVSSYHDALVLSDINVQTLSAMKNSLTAGRYSTLAFGEFEKLYQRNSATAQNIEGHIKALIEEGFSQSSFEDQRIGGSLARCAVIAGLTPDCYSRMFTRWESSGFLRRFLIVRWSLENEDLIVNAISKWKHLDFGKVSLKSPANGIIEYKISEKENSHLLQSLDHQPGRETPFVLAKKIFCVLKWRYKVKKALDIWNDFAESLLKTGAKLEI